MKREEIKVIFDEHLNSLDCLNNDTEMAMYLRMLDATERIVKTCNIHNVSKAKDELLGKFYIHLSEQAIIDPCCRNDEEMEEAIGKFNL